MDEDSHLVRPPPKHVGKDAVQNWYAGQFCHQACAERCCGLVCAIFGLMVLGAVLMGAHPFLAAMVLVLGPSFVIIYTFYLRFWRSTSPSQVVHTFCEAICWILPLLLLVHFVDVWNLSLTGRPMEIECSWSLEKGGRAFVYGLSFSAHCNGSAFTGKFKGHWDERQCSSAYGELPVPMQGNASVPILIRPDGLIAPSALLSLEKISTNFTGGTTCPVLGDGLKDALDSVLVRSIAHGDQILNLSSKKSLAGAYDSLFLRTAKDLASCPCRKSFWNKSSSNASFSDYDFCGPEGTCFVSCKPPDEAAPCSPLPATNVSAVFSFTQNTVANTFVTAYFRAGFLEEVLKYVAVRRVLFKDRVVDCGGLAVYGLAAAAGFATAENIEYAMFHGLLVAFGRMVLSVPAHCSTGLIIGILLGYRKFLGPDAFPAMLQGLPKPVASGGFFVLTLAVPVFLHGTYDFVLMLPSYVPIHPVIRAFIAMITTTMGFVFCRCAWLRLTNVCVVRVEDLQKSGLVSASSGCCCECDCCTAPCIQEDPMLKTMVTPPQSPSSAPGCGLESVLPKVPTCQTAEHQCNNCGRAVRINILYPSECPYCGFAFPDFVRKSVLAGMQGQQLLATAP